MLGGPPGVLGTHGQLAVEAVMEALESEDVPVLAESPVWGPTSRNNSATHSPAQVCHIVYNGLCIGNRLRHLEFAYTFLCMTVRSLLARAWYRCTPAGKVEVMFETSFNPRKGYFLVDIPLRYDVVVFEPQKMEYLASL